jgi:hypothetical protein
MTSGNAPVGHERGSEGKRSEEEEEELAPSGYPGVGGADGDTPAAGVACASLSREAEPIPPKADGAGCSPSAVWPLRCRSIDSVDVTDTDGSREC